MQPREHTHRWEAWIEEMEDHPLDLFEYESMLMCRDGVEEEAEVAGDQALFECIDALDARFEAITVETTTSPVTRRGAGWWWSRVPAGDDAQGYLAQ